MFAIDSFYIFIHKKIQLLVLLLLQNLTCWVRLERCLTVTGFQNSSKNSGLWAVQTVKCLMNPCWQGWKIKWSSSSSKESTVDNLTSSVHNSLSPVVWESLWSVTLALSSPITIMDHITLKMCSLMTELLNQLLTMLVSNTVLLNKCMKYLQRVCMYVYKIMARLTKWKANILKSYLKTITFYCYIVPIFSVWETLVFIVILNWLKLSFEKAFQAGKAFQKAL